MHSETHPCTDICNVTQTHTQTHIRQMRAKNTFALGRTYTRAHRAPSDFNAAFTVYSTAHPWRMKRPMLSCSKHIKTVHAKATCQQLCERNHVNATTNRSRNQCTTHVKLLTEFIKRGSPSDKHITPQASLFSLNTRVYSPISFL